MTKTIIKEVCIMLLLLIAIVLIFGVLFYEYIPINKTIPNKVTYKLPEEIANEMQQAEIQETAPVNVIYQIDESELKMYEKSKNYKPGKQDPFATVGGDTANQTTSNSQTNSTQNSANNTGSYLNNAGSK